MDLELKGKRALVTGSSSGLGATGTGARGGRAAVVVHGRDQARAALRGDQLGVQAVVTVGT
jgi:NAD(P)-dependent dehydrogenase (short-subunit alcohol dehydrogenase family)